MASFTKFANIVHRISTVANSIGAGFLVGMMLLIVANVIIRSFGNVIAGSYETVGLMGAVLASCAIAHTAIKKRHVAIDIVLRRLPQRVQAILGAFVSLLGLGIWAIVAWQGARFAWRMHLIGETTELLEIPIPPFRLFFIFGVVILCLVLLIDLRQYLRKVTSKWNQLL